MVKNKIYKNIALYIIIAEAFFCLLGCWLLQY